MYPSIRKSHSHGVSQTLGQRRGYRDREVRVAYSNAVRYARSKLILME